MPAYRAGRHEFGQNFLSDRDVIDQIVGLVPSNAAPIIEIGSGRGALTLPMQSLRRPVTAIEIDERHARWLRQRAGAETTIVCADFLGYRLPPAPHVIVGNLPFHQTTAILRKILHAGHWTNAVLLVQWEVARRRAGVGGATMMTAQWWPWFGFRLVSRVPANAFTPPPSVDAGLLTIERRARPLVEVARRRQYQSFVHAVFSGKGRGLGQILLRLAGPAEKEAVRRWLAVQRFRGTPLPRDLSAEQWAQLFAMVQCGSAIPVR